MYKKAGYDLLGASALSFISSAVVNYTTLLEPYVQQASVLTTD